MEKILQLIILLTCQAIENIGLLDMIHSEPRVLRQRHRWGPSDIRTGGPADDRAHSMSSGNDFPERFAEPLRPFTINSLDGSDIEYSSASSTHEHRPGRSHDTMGTDETINGLHYSSTNTSYPPPGIQIDDYSLQSAIPPRLQYMSRTERVLSSFSPYEELLRPEDNFGTVLNRLISGWRSTGGYLLGLATSASHLFSPPFLY